MRHTMQTEIFIKGARENNLKNIDLTVPRDKLIVFTGLSGSGKSSLAFETIFAEGQRRYVESLSTYARQFLGQMDKPDVDYIEGLSPAVSIDQKSTSNNPRSTVGTVTEIYDYLRLFFARVGVPHCPKCGREIARQSIDQVVDKVKLLPLRSRILIVAPVIRAKKGEHVKLLEQIRKDGYVRVKIDGTVYDINDVPKLDKKLKHSIDVVIDRLVIKEGIDSRLTDSLEAAFALGDGLAKVDILPDRDAAEENIPAEKKAANGGIIVEDGVEELLFSQNFACHECGISIEEMSPRMFSFNSPFGACPDCFGLGYKMEFAPELMIPDETLSINAGAIAVMGWQSCNQKGSFTNAVLHALAERYGFDLDTPFCDYPEKIRSILLHGTDGEKVDVYYEGQRGKGVYPVAFEGLIQNVNRRYRETGSETIKQEYENFMRITPCKTCGGMRLKKESLAVTIADKNIYEITSMSIEALHDFLGKLKLTKQQELIGERILKEIRARVGFLVDVGLEYLSLARATATLSGGEAQRLSIARAMLKNAPILILDEATAFADPDNERQVQRAFENLSKDKTVIMIAHRLSTVTNADQIYVLKDGKIAESGTHDALAAKDGIYTHMWNEYNKSVNWQVGKAGATA